MRNNRFSTCPHITNLLKHFSTQTTTAATQQALLRTNASKVVFDENIKNFKTRLVSRAYPSNLVDKILSEVNFAERKNALTQKQKVHKKILPFVTQFQPSLPCLKNILMDTEWHLIQNQPLLREIYKEPPFIYYRKGKSLKDMLIKAKL